MTDKSSSALHESLSALMDGESSDLDLHRVLKSVDDDSVRQAWSRYHATSQVIRASDAPDLSLDISKSVMQAIADEPDVSAGNGGLNLWWRGAGKTAVAACATFGVVFGVQQFTADAPDISNQTVVAEVVDQNPAASGSTVPQGFELPPLQAQVVSTDTFVPQANVQQSPASQAVTTTWIVSSDELQAQINRLMFKHAEQASSSSGMGVMPFARISELSENEEQE